MQRGREDLVTVQASEAVQLEATRGTLRECRIFQGPGPVAMGDADGGLTFVNEKKGLSSNANLIQSFCSSKIHK